MDTMTYDSKLIAIDPAGCGCTECMVGEYRPADQASDDEIRALFLGLLNDNTSGHWHITQHEDGGFDISGGMSRSVHVERITLPIPVEYFQITANHSVIADIAHGSGYID